MRANEKHIQGKSAKPHLLDRLVVWLSCKKNVHSWIYEKNDHGPTGYRYCEHCRKRQGQMYKRFGNIRYYWRDMGRQPDNGGGQRPETE